MAHFQSDYPTQAPSTDEYGNPIQHGATGQGVHDTTQLGTGTHGTGGAHTGYGGEAQGDHGITKLTRSGSSSSSSEDDGEGGRRKKGIGQKIKEKLPGGKKTDDPYNTTPTSTAYGGGHQQAKPGMVDQLKEKIPGGRKEEPYGTGQHNTTTPGYGTGTGTGTGGYPTGTGGHQKPGMVEQMKEKIPGAHKEDPYSTGQHTGQHTTTAEPGYGTTGAAGQQHEKKGMMEKIKEKLPGGNTNTR